MAAWRRKALEAFPDLKTSLNDSQYSPYSLFSDLLPRWRSAHDTGDETTLEAIYDYAAWCMAQSASELWNAAGVSFYEHLFDQPQHWEVVIAYFSSDAGREICRSVSGLWEARWPYYEQQYTVAQLKQLRQLIDGCIHGTT